MTLVVLLGSVGESIALPECEGSPREITSPADFAEWDNCEGAFIVGGSSKFAGDNYVGEFRNDKRHGRGTYTKSNGRVYEGTWEDGEFVGN